MPEKSHSVGLRIPAELLQQIEASVGEIPKGKLSSVLIELICKGLSASDEAVEQSSNNVEQRLTSVEQRLTAIERLVKQSAPPVAASEMPAPVTPPTDQWMNTGHAYRVATQRGYKEARVTFRRDLRQWRETGSPPQRLAAMGLEADFELRAASKEKDNSIKWLRFVD